MDPLLEITLQRHRRSARAPRDRRRPTRFERWALSTVTGFRVGQTALYIGTAAFGATALKAGIPAFQIAAPEGWTPIWASVLVLGAVIASFGSVSEERKFEITELVGAWLMFLTLMCYAAVVLFIGYTQNDDARQSVGTGFFALALPAGVRMIWLMARIRIWRAEAKARRDARAAAELKGE